MNSYIGHESQLFGVEEHRLAGGKGDGMRLLQVKNGKGLSFTISADRCADISRLEFMGRNMGYFSPCGYVAPAYYDDKGIGFLKSFTAGFMTTCGLCAVGSPCIDEGEVLPLHGTIANTPAEHIYWEQEENALLIHADISDEKIFSHKLLLKRMIICSLTENKITIKDKIENRGDMPSPVMLLYHMNIGFPLLSEKTEVYIPSDRVVPRNEHAAKNMESWQRMLPPTPGFEEQCYFHHFEREGKAGVFNSEIGLGLILTFDAENLPYFTEWKMMGERDYVLGLEPGNCHPDGRDKMRQKGALTTLEPGQKKQYQITIRLVEGKENWKSALYKDE